MFIALGVSIVGVFIISMIVFGGGQVFIPLFRSLWTLMGQFSGIKLQALNEQMDAMITAANATPGVVSTQFALFTGFIVANGAWWGWLSMLLTYVIFTLPAILFMLLGMKFVKKSSTNIYLKNAIVFLRPAISAILVALAVQLFIGASFPNVIFNGQVYVGLVNPSNSFFVGWRFWVLIAWVPLVIIESFILINKKVSLLLLIITHIVVAILIFAPWVV
ncbi:chromate transporter [[Mycoplasma] mobile]|uniref:Chromate transport protein n=1 Tax=Mycoplasma mobile (strain ATCC 43663 / 163K / NCTC 11711) TaxID=267748 RepID=Q6KHI7_MYCM1|nr:chromate transporter [[Mycoplasma] mobile]AAT27943.1 chromate transport protein [Mycoplasma mobile 163K]